MRHLGLHSIYIVGYKETIQTEDYIFYKYLRCHLRWHLRHYMRRRNKEATTKENTYYIILYLGKDRWNILKETGSGPG